jgi:integrase
MRGHVRKRGNKWAVVYDEGRDENGKRIQRWQSGYKTRRDAERGLTEILGRLEQGSYAQPSSKTVADFLAEWLETIKGQVRPTTLSSYRMLVDKHISPRIGSTPLQKLNAPQLNAMYADMLKSGRRNGKGGLSVRTVRYAHTVVRKALSDAVGWNLITRNVADAAQPPKKQKTTKETWGAEQLRTFLTQVREDRLFAAWQLAALTGMRRGEVLGLSWADIDLDASRLAVRRSLISSDYEIKVSEPKTEKGRRVVALDPAMVAALRDHQGRQLLERAAMGGDWDNELDLVFTREDGSPIHPQVFSEMFERHVTASKLPKLSLHGLRHTHATIALRAGVHPKVVSERLGHASVAFTLDVYTDSLPDMQETAASLIAALVLDS